MVSVISAAVNADATLFYFRTHPAQEDEYIADAVNRFQAYFNRKYTGREDGLGDTEPEGRKIDEIFLIGLSPEKQRETNFVWPLLNGEGTTFFDFNGGDAGEFPLPGGGGGGSSTPQDPATTDPCAKARAGVTKANQALSDTRLKTGFTDRMMNIAKTTTGAETSITIGKNEAGQLHIGDEVTKTGASGTMVDPPQGYKAFVDGHNHEFGHPPSPGDVWTMMERMAKSDYFETRYIFAKDSDETIYALTVNNRQQALDFLAKYPKDKYLEKDSDGNYTGSLKVGTDIEIEYKRAYDFYYSRISPGDFHARVAAQSYFLSKFNSGISISKKTKYDNVLKTVNSSSDDKGNYTTSQCN